MVNENSFKKNLISVGINGFPRGSAEVEKFKLIAKTISKKYNVYLLSNSSLFTDDYPYKGLVDQINYYYSTLSYKRKSPIENRFRRVLGCIIELLYIQKKRPKVAFIFSISIFDIVKYVLLFRLVKSRKFLFYVEDVNSIYKNKLSNFLYHKFAFKIVDGVIPISDFLILKIRENYPTCNIYKLPILVDVNRFNLTSYKGNYSQEISERYFLYCGGASYYEVIDFIVKSFNLEERVSKLYLIIHGQKEEILNLKNKLESKSISIFSNLDFEDLVAFYNNAEGLLVPLRENFQDAARFPHKIGEYCASGKILITNNWGEIPKYFDHMVNAYICENYDINQYSDAYKFIENNRDFSREIGKAGKELAYRKFDYSNYERSLLKFIDNN